MFSIDMRVKLNIDQEKDFVLKAKDLSGSEAKQLYTSMYGKEPSRSYLYNLFMRHGVVKQSDCYVYAIIDPKTNVPMYYGETTDFVQRASTHLKRAHKIITTGSCDHHRFELYERLATYLQSGTPVEIRKLNQVRTHDEAVEIQNVLIKNHYATYGDNAIMYNKILNPKREYKKLTGTRLSIDVQSDKIVCNITHDAQPRKERKKEDNQLERVPLLCEIVEKSTWPEFGHFGICRWGSCHYSSANDTFDLIAEMSKCATLPLIFSILKIRTTIQPKVALDQALQLLVISEPDSARSLSHVKRSFDSSMLENPERAGYSDIEKFLVWCRDGTSYTFDDSPDTLALSKAGDLATMWRALPTVFQIFFPNSRFRLSKKLPNDQNLLIGAMAAYLWHHRYITHDEVFTRWST